MKFNNLIIIEIHFTFTNARNAKIEKKFKFHFFNPHTKDILSQNIRNHLLSTKMCQNRP